MKRTIIAALLALTASQAFADVKVTFREGAPKDRFTIENTGNCPLGPLTVTIDLSGSAAGLVFDVTNRGAGVQVFQPFELVSGSANVIGNPSVRDGDNAVVLKLSALTKANPVAFTIDVDDTKGSRAITVSGSEITGASFTAVAGGETAKGTFSSNATANAKLANCQS
jgi:hypothetical protein